MLAAASVRKLWRGRERGGESGESAADDRERFIKGNIVNEVVL